MVLTWRVYRDLVLFLVKSSTIYLGVKLSNSHIKLGNITCSLVNTGAKGSFVIKKKYISIISPFKYFLFTIVSSS